MLYNEDRQLPFLLSTQPEQIVWTFEDCESGLRGDCTECGLMKLT
jgi:hypothetical protein